MAILIIGADVMLYLASRSPRRSQLLAQIGVDFAQMDVEIEEVSRPGEPATDYVRRMAREKAQAGFSVLDGKCPVLAADTDVVVDGRILGKPTDEECALAMLSGLSGRTHEVMSAVALIWPQGEASRLSISQVGFRILTEAEMRAYWRSGEPADKAGSYAIQGLAALFIDRLQGSYSGVMGLPLFETATLLAEAGLSPVWIQ